MTPGISNYELLNNVPPNVSLQRSGNVVPDTQLSPGFSPNLLQQQLSPNQRAPFSPQSNQINYQTFNTNTGQRLSPQQQVQQVQQQQQQMAFQSGTSTNSSQLSPRQHTQVCILKIVQMRDIDLSILVFFCLTPVTVHSGQSKCSAATNTTNSTSNAATNTMESIWFTIAIVTIDGATTTKSNAECTITGKWRVLKLV